MVHFRNFPHQVQKRNVMLLFINEVFKTVFFKKALNRKLGKKVLSLFCSSIANVKVHNMSARDHINNCAMMRLKQPRLAMGGNILKSIHCLLCPLGGGLFP